MNARTAARLRLLVKVRKQRAYLEQSGPGFFRRWPIKPIRRTGVAERWDYGYEIHGYGTSYCEDAGHRPHPSRRAAAECGRRFEAGLPPLTGRLANWRYR